MQSITGKLDTSKGSKGECQPTLMSSFEPLAFQMQAWFLSGVSLEGLKILSPFARLVCSLPVFFPLAAKAKGFELQAPVSLANLSQQ